ncbi:cupin domain-containing protein [Flagellimonas oceanensis]|uniref:cupin domain-containing protein n=1 Tax=Flagellimonas oceanensis TaxID=2499163 RepID=UPI003BA98F50
MNYRAVWVLFLIGTMVLSCKKETAKDLKKEVKPESSLVFDKGEKITNANFVGNAWLEMLVHADSINRNSVGSVTFEPGARTNWHTHPNGQIILVIDGEGFYQEKGSPKKILRKGEVVKCPANTPHWHGASTEQTFIQVAITSRVAGPTVWLEPVTDEVYMESVE